MLSTHKQLWGDEEQGGSVPHQFVRGGSRRGTGGRCGVWNELPSREGAGVRDLGWRRLPQRTPTSLQRFSELSEFRRALGFSLMAKDSVLVSVTAHPRSRRPVSTVNHELCGTVGKAAPVPALKMAACLPSRHGSSSPAGGAIPPRDATATRPPCFRLPHPGNDVTLRSGSSPPRRAVWRNRRPPSRRGGSYGIACACGTAARNPPPPSATGRRIRCWSWRRRLRICRYRPRWGGGAGREGRREEGKRRAATSPGGSARPDRLQACWAAALPRFGVFLRFLVLTITCR